MTRMTRPDCAVMCNFINTHTHTHTHCCTSTTVATCSNFIAEKTGKLNIFHFKIRFRTIFPPHGHRAYFPAFQLSNLYLSIPTRREHEKHNNNGTTIRTAKSARTCVQFGQAADNMQATRRRSCCVYCGCLYLPFDGQMIYNMHTNSRQAARRG